MEKALILGVIVALSSGCIAFETQRVGTKMVIGLSMDMQDVQTGLDAAVKKANVAVDKINPIGE